MLFRQAQSLSPHFSPLSHNALLASPSASLSLSVGLPCSVKTSGSVVFLWINLCLWRLLTGDVLTFLRFIIRDHLKLISDKDWKWTYQDAFIATIPFYLSCRWISPALIKTVALTSVFKGAKQCCDQPHVVVSVANEKPERLVSGERRWRECEFLVAKSFCWTGLSGRLWWCWWSHRESLQKENKSGNGAT